jgi:phospholipid/cholesterol/gamma-HCH transport system permease protein
MHFSWTFDPETNLLRLLGGAALAVVRRLGSMTLFLGRALAHIFILPFQWRKILDQLHFIGAKSILIIVLTGAFTGMVLGLQGYYSLVRFGSEAMLGSVVGLALVREMGPVLGAFMVIARAGSSMASEIAVMRISEQIDALATMDINPVRFLVSPRVVAALISFPLLTAIFDVVGIIGGYLSGSALTGLESGVYFASVTSGVENVDILGGFYKSLVFGVLIILICCYQGYYAHKTSAGFGSRAVALASTSAVVMSCVTVLVSDYVMTSFLME